jgi:predicted MFS family arabinose efflux permease
MLAPLKYPAFRRVWTASLLSNLGSLIQGVGAAWIMTQLTSKAGLVALVQTAQMGPMLLLALPAGAIADMFDRRKVALVGLCIAFAGAATLATLSFLGWITPPILLAACVVIGAGGALLGPAWQASVGEQVPPEALPAAVALNSISYNIARSFGPAIGGVIVAAAGAAAAFAANAACYLPLFYALFRWKRVLEPPRLPPEGLGRAMISGVRFVFHSSAIRTVLMRTLATGMMGAGISALMPLVARGLLGGSAQTFGLLLGAFGVGAVTGALNITRLRSRLSAEHLVRTGTFAMGVGVAVVGVSTSLPLTAAALFLAGGCWMLTINEFNIAIQTSAPRWVTGRALAVFQAAIAGGVAIGAWGWGQVAQAHGLQTALELSALGLVIMPLAGIRRPLGDRGLANAPAEPLAEPEVALALTHRSGPIRVELEYKVDPSQARTFFGIMQQIGKVRRRTGGYDWSIARDIAQPELWIESYNCPTWLDYLRQRDRLTQAERDLQTELRAFNDPDTPVLVRRWLERPFGSVRWQEGTPDRGPAGVTPL